MMSENRRTVGLLVSGIMDDFTEALCRGVMKEMAVQNTNLIVFPGKYLDRDVSGNPEIMYEYQFNTIFDYAGVKALDGLIVSASNVGCFCGDERVRELLKSYGDIPCVMVASKMSGYISVNYDNESGVREGLTYLIEQLGCRQLAMLAGPDGNADSLERKNTFVEVLTKYGLPLTERQIVYGNLSRTDTRAIEQVLDQNSDAEAIFCVNDDMAMGLYEAMRQRGLVPGEDIRIFGYDNTPAGSRAQPPLATVGSDAVVLGETVARTMIELLDDQDPDSVVLPAKFIPRNSLGNDIAEKSAGFLLSEERIDEYFDTIFYRYRNVEQDKEMGLRPLFARFIRCILRCVNDSADRQSNVEKLLQAADDFLLGGALEYADIDDMLTYAERLYAFVYERLQGSVEQHRIRYIFNMIYRKIIRDMDTRVSTLHWERQDDIYALKIFVRDSMQFRRGNDAAYADLLKAIDWLKIKNAYLYIFEEPVPHLFKETFQKPKHVLLKAYLENGELHSVPANGQKIKITHLFDHKYMTSARHDFVLLPLFYDEMQYGLVLCDLTGDIFSSGEFFANEMGTAVHMIDLLKENEKIQQQLGETLASLREHNIELDNLSKQDALTGIHNRRGFSEAASALIDENCERGLNTLTAYVDMNNLKVINDRYGHEDGDYSLKLISDVLKQIAEDNGVVGRIGGDEYAFALTMKPDMTAKGIERRIHTLFDKHNRVSDKPYNVTVSVGFYEIEANNRVALADALSYADEKLYIAKQHKVRTVEKTALKKEA